MAEKTNLLNHSKKMLEQNQVHIWRVNIDNPTLNLDDLFSDVLSDDERKRVDRLKSEKDKRRFIVSRGLLRENLGNYIGTEPSDITFTYNKYGKPGLKPEHNLGNIKFNVSHSANLAIYAISQNREVGIDLEYIREVRTADKIIKRFFTQQETDFYYSQPENKKKLAFFTLWTRKEAYSKARGMGIGLPSKEFDLNLAPTTVTSTTNTKAESKWSLVDIEIDEDYLAALATEGKDIEICRFEFKTL